MKTFTELKSFADNIYFHRQKQHRLHGFSAEMIDPPILHIINTLNQLPYCFTLQSCYGHFVFKGQENIHDCASLPPIDNQKKVTYRIAYIALCLDNSEPGKKLLARLQEMTKIDPDYIQVGCADWFWQQQVNSYVLQVEPKRFMRKDRAVVEYEEALHLEKVRNELFSCLVTCCK